MEAGSAVARTSSRAARPCAADAAPPRYLHIREEASRSELLDPREQPRASARRSGGKQEGAAAKERARIGLLWVPPSPLAYIAPRWATLGSHFRRPLWA